MGKALFLQYIMVLSTYDPLSTNSWENMDSTNYRGTLQENTGEKWWVDDHLHSSPNIFMILITSFFFLSKKIAAFDQCLKMAFFIGTAII